jgi:hypothetical protein
MAPQVPRILPLSEPLGGADGTRFALLHVVSDERHHLGWFELSDDPWRVGLTEAGAVADAGVPAEAVAAETSAVLQRLRAARDADEVDVPEPVGPIDNRLRYLVDRGRAIERLEGELVELRAP